MNNLVFSSCNWFTHSPNFFSKLLCTHLCSLKVALSTHTHKAFVFVLSTTHCLSQLEIAGLPLGAREYWARPFCSLWVSRERRVLQTSGPCHPYAAPLQIYESADWSCGTVRAASSRVTRSESPRRIASRCSATLLTSFLPEEPVILQGLRLRFFVRTQKQQGVIHPCWRRLLKRHRSLNTRFDCQDPNCKDGNPVSPSPDIYVQRSIFSAEGPVFGAGNEPGYS